MKINDSMRVNFVGLIVGLFFLKSAMAEVVRLECPSVGAQNFSLTFEIDTDNGTVNGSPADLRITSEAFTFNYKLEGNLYSINRATGQTIEESWGSDSIRVRTEYLCKRARPSRWWKLW